MFLIDALKTKCEFIRVFTEYIFNRTSFKKYINGRH
jgi:hypothetical protein